MFQELSSDLLELLNKAVKNNINEYAIYVKSNDKGGGYMGDIQFITLVNKTTNETKYFVLKQEPSVGMNFVKPCCQNENYFYKVIWPSLQEFYGKRTGKVFDMVPYCFGTSENGYKKILLENLQTKGFQLHDKTKTLNHEHLEILFKTYGVFHAISMALRVQNNEEFKRFVTTLTSLREMIFINDDFLSLLLIQRLKECRKYFDPITDGGILNKLNEFETNAPARIHEALNDYKKEGVIIHGDCWNNNYLFKYNVSNIFCNSSC